VNLELVVVLGIGAIAGRSGIRVDGACSYVREVRTCYQCKPAGRSEQIKVEPKQ
jgi:hypothetical protein